MQINWINIYFQHYKVTTRGTNLPTRISEHYLSMLVLQALPNHSDLIFTITLFITE